MLAAHHQQEGLGAAALLSTRASPGRLPDASTIRKKSSSIKTSIAHKNQCELLAHRASCAWLPRFLSARAKRELEAPRAQAGAGQPGLPLPVGTDSSSPVQPGARCQSLGSPKTPRAAQTPPPFPSQPTPAAWGTSPHLPPCSLVPSTPESLPAPRWHRREPGHSHQGTAPRARRQPGTYTALCISSSLRIILRAVPSKTPFKGVSQQQALQTQPRLSGSPCPPEHQDRPQDEQCKHGRSGGRGLMQEAWKHPRGCSREGRAASPLLLRAPGGSGDLPAPGLGSCSKRCGFTGAVQKRMQAALLQKGL